MALGGTNDPLNSQWGYVGVQGYYNQQASMQQQNALQNVYGNLAGAGLGGSLYGGLAQQAYATPYGTAHVIASSNEAMQSLFNGIAEAPKVVKQKAKRFIERLRAEIDDWHGDVLCRAEA